jgi:hypothetical protein
LSPPAIRNPFFHVGFIVPEWRAPVDAMVPLSGPDGVIESKVYSVY